MNVCVLSNGDIIWKLYVVFDIKCLINIEFFLFDKQVCFINIVVWNSDNLMVMLIKGFVFFEVDDDLIGGYWMILDLKVEILIDDGMFFIIYMFMWIYLCLLFLMILVKSCFFLFLCYYLYLF